MGDQLFAPGLAEQLASAWDTGPRVFRQVLTGPAFSPREYMEGVVGTARDYVANPTNRCGRVFVAGEVVKPEQLPPFLPTSPSQAIDAYIAALTSVHPDFAVVLNGCERYIPSIRARFIPLLHDLFSHVGYPVQTSLGCIYSGTYRTSPFGIHTDPCHVLMSCGIGRKTMAFWPRAYFESMTDLLYDNKVRVPVADHLDRATVLEIEPGDLLYWPANTWHVGISETPAFHASLSLGIYHRASNAGLFLSQDVMPRRAPDGPQFTQYDALDLHGFDRRLAGDGELTAERLKTTNLSPFFAHWERVREALNTPGEAEYRVLTTLLLSMSSAGFGQPRAELPQDALPLPGATLQCSLAQAIVTARVRDGILVGANGHVFFHRGHVSEVERVVLDLRRGAPRRYDDLLASVGDARTAVDAVLHDLVSADALSIQLRHELTGLRP